MILLCSAIFFKILYCESSVIFHENTKITFRTGDVADYFGYTVLLYDAGLYVGAPKAKSKINKSISPGLVFSCPIDKLKKAEAVICRPLQINGLTRKELNSNYYDNNMTIRDEMWFGAAISLFPTGELLICAPRWTVYKYKDYVPNGACYVFGRKSGYWLLPLQDSHRRNYQLYGLLYKKYTYGLYDYDFAQAGMSVKVTKASTLIIGAPGLLVWTGGVQEYKLNLNSTSKSIPLEMLSVTYEYNEENIDLLHDYLGYSVESGEFDASGKTLCVAGAPRSKKGYGQVIIFERSILNIKAQVYGPHMGSYFGASILCVDINGDGVVDLLVGAPNYIKKNNGLSYNQGAVFVYLTERLNRNFDLKEVGLVMGSEKSGSRFGTAIAELGDIDGDGFNDVAIGAPWEDNGMGAVYIYRGCPNGLQTSYTQRIIVTAAKSFGISISKGVDIDSNNCNDLAVGAYQTGSAYIFRCIPTIQVLTVINGPNAMQLPQNVTNFTASFCIDAAPKKKWPYVKLGFTAKIIVDPMMKRARIIEDSEYNVSVTPGKYFCEEKTFVLVSTDGMSKPISIQFHLAAIELMKDDSPVFLSKAARLSDDSVLKTSIDIHVDNDCGEDFICTPLLTMTLKPLTNPYIPGSDDRLGFTIKVLNMDEPARGAKVHMQLPSNPVRLPRECILKVLNVTCMVPSPLNKEETIFWEIELESTLKGIIDKELTVLATLDDNSKINDSTFETLKITVTPVANISISAEALPNKSITVTRNMFDEGGNISLVHRFEVKNFGPSDLYALLGELSIPDQASLSRPVQGCFKISNKTECTWSLPAKVSLLINLPFQYNLGTHKDYLAEKTSVAITSTIELLLENKNQSLSITTTLVLDPDQPLWPVIVGMVVGFILLAATVFILYKYGFFKRTSKDELKKLQDSPLHQEDPHTSTNLMNSGDACYTKQLLELD